MPTCLIKRLTEKLKRKKVDAIGSVANVNMDEVAYAEWSCICVGKSYGETTFCDYDRIYWIPGLVTVPKPPLPPSSRKNPKDWECIIVYVMLDEVGAKETSEFIRKFGGIVTQKELDRYRKSQLAPLRTKREKGQLACP